MCINRQGEETFCKECGEEALIDKYGLCEECAIRDYFESNNLG